MSNDTNRDGWNEYSRLVLTELDTLNTKVDSLVKENNYIKRELSKLEQIKDEISTLKDWKGNVDEVSSPTQLKELQKEVESIKTFKTVSTTVWVIVQIIFGITVTIIGLYLKSN